MSAPHLIPSLDARRRSLFRRIHFWAALIATPFTLIATLTGLLYVFTPQIEAILYARLDRVTPLVAMRSLDESVAAAQSVMPAGWYVHSVIPPLGAGDSVRVQFAPPDVVHADHGGHNHGPATKPGEAPRPSFGLPANAMVAYVDPYGAEVLGTLAYEDRFSIWARKLHSRLLQDDTWRWMIELAASWMIVMLATGIWLWWPRGHLAAFPRAGMRGRAFWRQWHAFLGVALSLVSLVILATGITWSMYAGEQVRTARDMVGQGPPQAPRNLKSVPAGTALNWQGAWEAARKAAPHISMQLTAPREAEGTWRASNADRSRPTRRFDMQFDAYSGKTLYYSGWDAQTAFGKATAIGIPFHRGEFGWWNQAILLIFGLGLLFSLVSGWVMFFKRRRTGRVGFPSLVPGAWRAASGTFWLAALCLFALLPLLAASAVLVCAAELILHRKQGAWARA